MNRIRSIDIWKGVTILSVLNIHTCGWSGALYLPEWTRHLALLIDVPVLFFISGFLLQSPDAKALLRRTKNQLIRLAGDYVTITAMALTLTVIVGASFGHRWFHELLPAILSAWVFQFDNPLWLAWGGWISSIWYLKFYILVLSLAIPILVSPLRRISLYLPGISYAFYLLLLPIPFLPSDFRMVLFYLTLFLAGAALKDSISHLTLRCLLTVWALVLAATAVITLREGFIPNLQAVKFPPAPLYLLFSLHSILTFCLLLVLENTNRFPPIPRLLTSFLSWCGQNIYRIYLLQAFVATVPTYYFVSRLLEAGLHHAVVYGIVLSWNIGVTLTLVRGYAIFMSGVGKWRATHPIFALKTDAIQ